MKENILDSYYPVNVVFHHNQPIVQFIKFPKVLFNQPFYNFSIQQYLKDNKNRPSFLLNLVTEGDILKSLHTPLPNGFIFHMSRCGSTLISQMLSSLHHCRTVSEPIIINQILNANLPTASKVKYLQLIMNALKVNSGQYFCCKFTSHAVMELSTIREAYPNVPWIFLIREPLEVMVSILTSAQKKKTYLKKLYGLASFMNLPVDSSLEVIVAQLLGNFLRLAYQNLDKNALIINYEQLPDILYNKVTGHFNIELTNTDQLQMENRALYHSKRTTDKVFNREKEKESKLAKVTPAIDKATQQWVQPWYDKLKCKQALQ